MKINEIPVAAPDDLDIAAVINPNPTELHEKIMIKRNAIMRPSTPPIGRYPIRKANKNTITVCRREIIM